MLHLLDINEEFLLLIAMILPFVGSLIIGPKLIAVLRAMKAGQPIREARKGLTGSILVNLSGRGDKDLDFVVANYGYGPDFLEKMAARRKG
jgi:predicted nucleotidyltransferase